MYGHPPRPRIPRVNTNPPHVLHLPNQVKATPLSLLLARKIVSLTVLRSSSAFWHCPGDILCGHFDVTQLAMYAVLQSISYRQNLMHSTNLRIYHQLPTIIFGTLGLITPGQIVMRQINGITHFDIFVNTSWTSSA